MKAINKIKEAIKPYDPKYEYVIEIENILKKYEKMKCSNCSRLINPRERMTWCNTISKCCDDAYCYLFYKKE